MKDHHLCLAERKFNVFILVLLLIMINSFILIDMSNTDLSVDFNIGGQAIAQLLLDSEPESFESRIKHNPEDIAYRKYTITNDNVTINKSSFVG